MLSKEVSGNASSVENVISGISAIGVYPFNPACIPDYKFTVTYSKLATNSKCLWNFIPDLSATTKYFNRLYNRKIHSYKDFETNFIVL